MTPRRTLSAITATLVLTALATAHADGRTDYLVRMLRESSLFRVRVQAALTLGEIADRTTVPKLVSALEDDEAAVRLAALAALGRIGDPSAVEPVRALSRDPDREVKRQARTTLRTLEAIAARTGVTTTPRGTGPSTGTSAPAAQARFYIGLGGMGNRAGVRGDELKGLLRRYLQAEVGASPTVVVTPDDESMAATTKVLKQRRLTGVWLDGSITKLTREGAGVRAEISLMVLTNPGRDLRMMLSGAASVSVSGKNTNLSPSALQELQNQALREASASAAHRLLTQLSSGVGLDPP